MYLCLPGFNDFRQRLQYVF